MKVQTSRQFLSRLASRRAARLFRVAALFTVGAISTARAATPYYWDPGASKSGTGSGGAGTWNTTLTNWYPGTGAVDVVWPNTTAYSAYFGGTAGTVTLGTAITADSVSFAVGGYTLATGANTLTLGGLSGTGVNSLIYAAAGTTAISGTIAITGATASNTEYITVASGAILNLSATVTQGNLANSGLTIFGPGTVNYSGALLSPGKFNVQGGATFNSSTNIALTNNGTYTGVADTVSGTTWNITGGIVGGTPTSTPTAVSALFVGNGAGTSGLFTISGGTALFTGIAAGNTFNGALTAGAGTGDSTGTVTISGGTLTDTGGVSLGSAKSGVGTLNLNGGTMNVGGVFSQNAGVTGTGGSSTVNFNGTQLNLTGSTATEIPTGYNLNVGTGGALISTTNSYGFLSPLLNVSGTDGGLKKSGTGTLVLAGQGATYNGGTALNAGTLTGQNNTTATTLTTFGTGTITLNAGTLSLVANGSANNQTIITGNGTTGNNVTVAGASTINVDRVTAATNGGTVGTFTGSTFQFNNLSIGSSTLSITSGNSYGVQFAGTTTLTANATFSIINSTLTLSGAIGDGGSGYGLTKTGSSGTTTLSMLTLGGVNTYSGATTVINPSTGFSASGITLSGSGTINNTSAVNISGYGGFAGSATTSGSGYLNLDNSTTALERIKNTASVNLSQGGELRLVGNSAGVTETIGALNMGNGQSLVTLTAGGAGVVTTLQAASLSRNTLGTGTVRGTSLGNNATNSTRIFLTTGPSGSNFVGTSTPSSLSGGTTTKNLKIIPWLIGDTGTASGNYGGGFVTYDTQSGLRPLVSGEVNSLAVGSNAYATTGENVQIAGGTTLTTTGASTLNSLYFISMATALTGSGGSLNINSGALGSGAATTTTLSGFSVVNLDNGEGIYGGNGSLTVSSPIDVTSGGVHSATGGFTKGGNGTLILTGANLFSGPTTINQGTLQVGAGGATGDLGTSSGVTINPGSTLSLVQATGSAFGYNVVNNGTLSVTNAGTETLSGNISGISGITQATAATTLTLSGTNSYTGATTVF